MLQKIWSHKILTFNKGVKMDAYTKTILTIITIALIWIAVQLTPGVNAGPVNQTVDIVAVGGRAIFGAELPVVVK